jgi:hypothetical protein
VDDEIQQIVVEPGVDVLWSVAVGPYDGWTPHVRDPVGAVVSVDAGVVAGTWLTRSRVWVVIRGQQGVLDWLRPRLVIVEVVPEWLRIEGMPRYEIVHVLRPSTVHLPWVLVDCSVMSPMKGAAGWKSVDVVRYDAP